MLVFQILAKSSYDFEVVVFYSVHLLLFKSIKIFDNFVFYFVNGGAIFQVLFVYNFF